MIASSLEKQCLASKVEEFKSELLHTKNQLEETEKKLLASQNEVRCLHEKFQDIITENEERR